VPVYSNRCIWISRKAPANPFLLLLVLEEVFLVLDLVLDLDFFLLFIIMCNWVLLAGSCGCKFQTFGRWQDCLELGLKAWTDGFEEESSSSGGSSSSGRRVPVPVPVPFIILI